MPDNQAPGMLEDFLLPLFTPAPLHTYVEQFVDGSKDESRGFNAHHSELHRAKAIVRAWMAIDNPSDFSWKDIRARLDLKHGSTSAFADWFKALFFPPAQSP